MPASQTKRTARYYRPTPVELEIEERRQLMKPLQYEWGPVPQWIKPLVKQAIKNGQIPPHCRGMVATAGELFEHSLRTFGGGWADHVGRVKVDGRWILVSEPYAIQVDASDMANLDRFCKAFGLVYRLSANGWHYPGATLQILVWQPE